jgi:hypothetical protein
VHVVVVVVAAGSSARQQQQREEKAQDAAPAGGRAGVSLAATRQQRCMICLAGYCGPPAFQLLARVVAAARQSAGQLRGRRSSCRWPQLGGGRPPPAPRATAASSAPTPLHVPAATQHCSAAAKRCTLVRQEPPAAAGRGGQQRGEQRPGSQVAPASQPASGRRPLFLLGLRLSCCRPVSWVVHAVLRQGSHRPPGVGLVAAVGDCGGNARQEGVMQRRGDGERGKLASRCGGRAGGMSACCCCPRSFRCRAAGAPAPPRRPRGWLLAAAGAALGSAGPAARPAPVPGILEMSVL